MIKKIVIGLAVVLAVLAVVVAMQPADFQVVRRTTIAAPPAVVFAQLNDFRKWQAWSPWEKMDPNLQRTYSGRFMAARLTWLTVVIGIGVDLAIALFIIPLDAWLRIAGVIAASSIAIIARSLLNDSSDHRALIERKYGDQNSRTE